MLQPRNDTGTSTVEQASGRKKNIFSAEQHGFQFRGINLPGELIEDLFSGKINATELKALIAIEALVEVRGVGCFASNRYLGEMLGVRPLGASQVIASLRKKGWVKATKKDGQRFLETAWSRPKFKAKPYRADNKTLSRQQINPIVKNDRVHIVKNDTIKNTEEKTKERPPAPLEEVAIAPSSSCAPPGGESGAKPVQPKAISLMPLPSETWEARCARLLRDALVKAGKLRGDYRLRGWEAPFRALCAEGIPANTVEAVLVWYTQHIDAVNVGVFSARSFRQCFPILAGKAQGGSASSRSDKAQSAQPRATPPELVDVIKEIESFGWGKGSLPKVRDEVIQSYSAIKGFYQDMKNAAREAKSSTLEGLDGGDNRLFPEFIECLKARLGNDPVSAVRRWYSNANKRSRAWKAWQGSMRIYRFSAESEDLKDIVNAVSSDFARHSRFAQALWATVAAGVEK